MDTADGVSDGGICAPYYCRYSNVVIIIIIVIFFVVVIIQVSLLPTL
jgi:hypothetical protein